LELAQHFFVYGLRAMLLQTIQPYANEVVLIALGYNVPTHPYFIFAPNGDGEVTDEEVVSDNRNATMLKAAYNDQTSLKYPGAHAPGGKYIIQLLYDSIAPYFIVVSVS